MAISRFKDGMRVMVRRVGDYAETDLATPRPGVVVRMRKSDSGAWVALDERSPQMGVHPFPEDDSRGRHVLTFPEFCEAP